MSILLYLNLIPYYLLSGVMELRFSHSPFDFGSIDTRNISGLHHSLHSVDMGFVTFICFCLFRPSDKFSYCIRHSAILMGKFARTCEFTKD